MGNSLSLLSSSPQLQYTILEIQSIVGNKFNQNVFDQAKDDAGLVSVEQFIDAILKYQSNLPPIRLIPFSAFKSLGTMPRYPENKDLCVELSTIDRLNSLLFFLSHCWLRGYGGAEGWDGRPHPDNAAGDKYRLCVDGVEKAWRNLAPEMTECYVWLDFGCMDQDGNPADELKQLDEIFKCCDCVFTPLVGPPANFPSVGINNWYKDYDTPSWNGGEYSYVNRAWCRVEMFFAANIPVVVDAARCEKFVDGLKHFASNGTRPHLIYGSYEENIIPTILPPLQNSYFAEYHPNQGCITHEADRAKIASLVEELLPCMRRVTEGYSGDRNSTGDRLDKDRLTYASGAVYEGGYVDGKMTGKGKYT